MIVTITMMMMMVMRRNRRAPWTKVFEPIRTGSGSIDESELEH